MRKFSWRRTKTLPSPTIPLRCPACDGDVDAAMDTLPDVELAICPTCHRCFCLDDVRTHSRLTAILARALPKNITVTTDSAGVMRVTQRDQSWSDFWLCWIIPVLFGCWWFWISLAVGGAFLPLLRDQFVIFFLSIFSPLLVLFGWLMMKALFGRIELEIRRTASETDVIHREEKSARTMGELAAPMTGKTSDLPMTDKAADPTTGKTFRGELRWIRRVSWFYQTQKIPIDETTQLRIETFPMPYQKRPGERILLRTGNEYHRLRGVLNRPADVEYLAAILYGAVGRGHFASPMIRCAECGGEIPGDSLSVATRLATCPTCGHVAALPVVAGRSRILEIHRQIEEIRNAELAKRPRVNHHVWVEQLVTGDGIRVIARKMDLALWLFLNCCCGMMIWTIGVLFMEVNRLPPMPDDTVLWTTFLSLLIFVIVFTVFVNLWLLVRTELWVRRAERGTAQNDSETYGTLEYRRGLWGVGHTRQMRWDRETWIGLQTVGMNRKGTFPKYLLRLRHSSDSAGGDFGGDSADKNSAGGASNGRGIGHGDSEDWQIGRMGHDSEIQDPMCIDIAAALVKAMDTLK